MELAVDNNDEKANTDMGAEKKKRLTELGYVKDHKEYYKKLAKSVGKHWKKYADFNAKCRKLKLAYLKTWPDLPDHYSAEFEKFHCDGHHHHHHHHHHHSPPRKGGLGGGLSMDDVPGLASPKKSK